MAGNFDYDRKKKIQSSVCWVRGSGNYDRKKDTVVCLTGCAVVLFFVVVGNFDYDQKKKDTVVCWREIGSFFVVAGNFYYDRKKKIHYDRKKKDTVVCLMGACAVLAITTGKKKDTVVCLAGCAVVLVFGSGRKLAFFL